MTKRPAVRRPKPWHFPKARETYLDNGLRVLVYPIPGQYVVSAGLALDISLSAEPPALEGVAALTLAALDEGTRPHPGTEFADLVEDAGAVLGGMVGFSNTQVHLDVPGSRLASALELMAEATMEPTLLDGDIERYRAIRLAEIHQERASSSEMAAMVLRRILLQPGCRAARPRNGTATTVADITGDAVRDFHRRWYGPEDSTLVIAGDFAEDQLGVLHDTFGTWKQPRRDDTVHEVPRPAARRAVMVHRPGAVQADVRLGQFSVDRRDARWADLQVATYALGGAFLSRLNRVLREEKGFTYGVHLGNSPFREGGFTSTSGSFRNEVVAEAIRLTPGLLDVSGQPLTADEVTSAATYLAGVGPLDYATSAGICHGVLNLLAADLTTDYIDSVRAAYALVTPESATTAATELLDPHSMSLVVVGDTDLLAAPLIADGWDVEVTRPEDWV